MDKLDLVSKKIMIKVNDEVSKKLADDWHHLEKQINKLKSFNTDEVEPMVRIDNNYENFLREDIPGKVLSKEIVLRNAPEKDNNYIIVSKVDEND